MRRIKGVTRLAFSTFSGLIMGGGGILGDSSSDDHDDSVDFVGKTMSLKTAIRPS